jgi:K+-transporting ATPase ATPase C chain
MLSYLRPALALLLLFSLLTGIAYPLAMVGAGQALFPAQANGSLIRNGDTVIGSSLIGQDFASERYFWPRPSATADAPYNAVASGGSNLGATSASLKKRIGEDVARLKAGGLTAPIPADGATASGSGLDPHITPDFAHAQVARVAAARDLPAGKVAELVDSVAEGRLLSIIGEPRVNVLALNIALDALQP